MATFLERSRGSACPSWVRTGALTRIAWNSELWSPTASGSSPSWCLRNGDSCPEVASICSGQCLPGWLQTPPSLRSPCSRASGKHELQGYGRRVLKPPALVGPLSGSEPLVLQVSSVSLCVCLCYSPRGCGANLEGCVQWEVWGPGGPARVCPPECWLTRERWPTQPKAPPPGRRGLVWGASGQGVWQIAPSLAPVTSPCP